MRRYRLAMLAEAAELVGYGAAASRLASWLTDELRYGECVVVGANVTTARSVATSVCWRWRWDTTTMPSSTTPGHSTCTFELAPRVGRRVAASTWPAPWWLGTQQTTRLERTDCSARRGNRRELGITR